MVRRRQAKTAKERSAILRRWAELMMAHQDDLAQIMTAEQGKPLAEAAARSPTAPRSSSGLPRRPSASTARRSPSSAPATSASSCIKQPIGVAAAITPWNFPNAMITRKVGPALAAGCAMVSSRRRKRRFGAGAGRAGRIRAGVPPACSRSSPARPAIGGELTPTRSCASSFTGSTEVGRLLMRSAPAPSRSSRWNSAATRRSSCSTTPISMRRSRAR
jgi:succinate-semialdehyde dehydrogenase/glutarate-semialdehyde dehydrogenase